MPETPSTKTTTILALDPSTDVTGVAVVTFDHRGRPVLPVAHVASFAATARSSVSKTAPVSAMTARFERIRQTREWLAAEIDGLGVALDAVVYERPFLRGDSANSALLQAIGAYVSLSALRGLPVYEVNTETVKASAGQGGIHARSTSRTAREANRAESKSRMIIWANMIYGTHLGPDDDAKADAIACATAGWLTLHRAAFEAEAKRKTSALLKR